MAPSRRSKNTVFPCTEPGCPKTFSRREYVLRHARLAHEGERPFQCSACDKAFARSDLLKRHIKSCKHKDDAGAGAGAGGSPSARHPTEGELSPQSLSSGSAPSPLPLLPTLPHDLPPYSQPPPAPQPRPPPASTNAPYSYAEATATAAATFLSTWSPMTDSTPSSTDSPPTPVGVPTSFSASLPALQYNDGRNSTLAPSLNRAFSQDEITASQVLEDLMRSPKSYAAQPYLSDTAVPWQGSSDVALAPSNLPQDSNAVTGWSDAMFDGGDNGIEYSPAALALSEYFNKGGVGGITALDLGFNYEPTLWPEWLLHHDPILHDETAMKYHLPKERFCRGYLQPWNIPDLNKLSKFGQAAAEKLVPCITHSGTLHMSTMSPAVAFALTVAGGQISGGAEGSEFSDKMLVEKRIYLVRSFHQEGATFDEQFAGLQSLLLYQMLGIFHKEDQHRLLAQTFHSTHVGMLRAISLPAKIRSAASPILNDFMAPFEMDQAWKTWVQVETWRRVAFLTFLSDLEIASMFGMEPLLSFHDMNIDLPSPDVLWNANSATEWYTHMTSPANITPVGFLPAIQALMLLQEPQPYDGHGIVLSELARHDKFPLLILARSLSFLQGKTEEALAQVDPFKQLLGGLDVYSGKERSDLELLKRIKMGRERLRRFPGGEELGGGEKWFNQTQAGEASGPDAPPQASAFGGAYAPTASSTTPSLFTDAEMDALRTKMAHMEQLREKRSRDLATEFPNYFPKP